MPECSGCPWLTSAKATGSPANQQSCASAPHARECPLVGLPRRADARVLRDGYSGTVTDRDEPSRREVGAAALVGRRRRGHSGWHPARVPLPRSRSVGSRSPDLPGATGSPQQGRGWWPGPPSSALGGRICMRGGPSPFAPRHSRPRPCRTKSHCRAAVNPHRIPKRVKPRERQEGVDACAGARSEPSCS